MESHAVYVSVGGSFVTSGSGLNITTGAQVNTQPITSFNTAIIPAAAVIIILVIVCIKGCKWFRHYTKVRRHEDESCYAEIVHDSDEDCGQIEITSETMSNVNYDTVSSYCSMYGRTAKDSSVTTASLHRQETIRKLPSSPRKDITQNLLLSDEIKEHETENGDTVYCIGKESIGCGRTMSDSSEETEIDPLFSSFSSDPGRRGMFRVSFTPESHMFSLADRQHQSNSEHASSQKMKSLIARRNTYSHKPINLKRSMCFPSKYTSPSTTKALFNSVTSVNKKQDSPCVINQRTNMISIGVQTNKSFIFSVSLKASNHVSKSGIDHRSVLPTRPELTETNVNDNQKNNLPSEAKRSDFKSDSISNIKWSPLIVTDRNMKKNINEAPTISCTISDEIGVNYTMEKHICQKYPIEPNILVYHKQNGDELTFTENVVDYEDDVFVTSSVEVHDLDIADMNSCRRTDTNSDQCWTDNSSHVHDQRATVAYNVSDSCDTSKRPYMQNRCQSLPCLYQLINNSRAMYIEPIENNVNPSTTTTTTTDESGNKIIDNPWFRSCSRITNILQVQSKDMNGNYSNTNAKQLDICPRCTKSYYQYQANALVNYKLLHNCSKDIHPKWESSVNSDGHNSSMNSLASSGYAENSFDSSN